MSRLGRVVAALAVPLAAMLVAAAFVPVSAHDPDPILTGGLFAQNATLKYRWASGGTPPAAMKTAIDAAADDANASRRSKAPRFDYASGGGNTVYYGATVPCGVNGIACMRRNAPDSFGVWFRENGRRFDWGTLRWCELSGAPNGCFEVENVMLDELGHVMVLDHHVNLADGSDYEDAVVQAVSRTKPNDGWNTHAFGRCDVATLQQQYDMLDWTSLYSTCLELPTVLALTPSRTSVAFRGSVTFTADLETDGRGKLSNNPVSGRAVVLQRRTNGDWTDLLTMAPGSSAGTYAASLTVSSTADYRAVFRRTSDEGLLASSSGAVTVTVSSGCTQSPCPLALPGR